MKGEEGSKKRRRRGSLGGNFYFLKDFIINSTGSRLSVFGENSLLLELIYLGGWMNKMEETMDHPITGRFLQLKKMGNKINKINKIIVTILILRLQDRKIDVHSVSVDEQNNIQMLLDRVTQQYLPPRRPSVAEAIQLQKGKDVIQALGEIAPELTQKIDSTNLPPETPPATPQSTNFQQQHPVSNYSYNAPPPNSQNNIHNSNYQQSGNIPPNVESMEAQLINRPPTEDHVWSPYNSGPPPYNNTPPQGNY